nr:SIS domain-containing protein [FCB group bacterium]
AVLLAQKKGINEKDRHNIIDGFKDISSKVKQILKISDDIREIAQDFVDSTGFLYLGRSYQFPVALEGALKLKEISYIHAEGYPAAEMKHGPIALIDQDMPVVFIVTGRRFEKILSNIQEVKARNGRLIIITTTKSEDLVSYSDHIIEIPEVHHCLAPLLTTIPLQLLAYHIAVLKGCDVDQPRNLAKSVTVE